MLASSETTVAEPSRLFWSHLATLSAPDEKYQAHGRDSFFTEVSSGD
jgi:hypothetical protein